MGRSSDTYRQKYRSIARFVSFKLPKRLTRSIKAKITTYHKRIGKALERGYKPTKARNDGRIEKAHRAQGIRGLPELKVVLVKPTGQGFRTSINRDGSIRSSNPQSGISKVTIEATFFDAEDYDQDVVDAEAARLTRAAKAALGHKPQRCAVAYWGGENAWAELSFLSDLLVVDLQGYGPRPYPADGVSFYWIKRTKRVAEIQQQLRDERSRAAERRAERRRRSDV